MKVIKRNGSEVDFDSSKIIVAITKANEASLHREMTEEQIREELGLDESLYEEVYAENTAENERPDTFIAVKAKSGKVDEVKEKLTAYKQRLIDENSFDANADKLNAAEVYSEGDYVFFVLLGDVDDGTSSEGFAEALGKEVQRGIDAIKAALGAL